MKSSVNRDEKWNFLIKLDVAVFGMLDNSENLNVWHSQRLYQLCLLTQSQRKPVEILNTQFPKMSQFTRERVRQRFMRNARAEAFWVIVLAVTNKEHNLIFH